MIRGYLFGFEDMGWTEYYIFVEFFIKIQDKRTPMSLSGWNNFSFLSGHLQ